MNDYHVPPPCPQYHLNDLDPRRQEPIPPPYAGDMTRPYGGLERAVDTDETPRIDIIAKMRKASGPDGEMTPVPTRPYAC